MTLEHLDTFIAFAVVMLGVSLLVTIFTQMVSSLFGLRGTNLKWGLTQLFRTLHPALGDRMDHIAEWVLTHPLISDSTLSRLGHGGILPAAFPPVRGALRRLLGWMSLPGRWRLASTIRLEELLGILRSYGVAPGAAPATPAEVMGTIAAGAGGVGPEVQALTAQVSNLAAGLPAAIPAGLLGGVRIDQLVQKLPATAEAELTSLKTYFNVVMDRVAQRFTLHARVWTVVFSILVAFALHLDAFRLLSQISSDAEMRAALVSSSKALVEKAAAIQSAQPGSSQAPQPSSAAAPQAQQGPSKNDPCAEPLHVPATYLCAMMKIGDPKVKKALEQSDAPSAFLSREDAVAWLQKTKQGDTDTERVVTQYETAVDSLLTDADRLVDRATSIRALLANGRFQLIPDPYHDWDFAPSWPRQVESVWQFWEYLWPPKNLHFWGILFSAGLLSLGAPFWFNALKTLSSLRPILAGKQEKEQKQQTAA